MNYWVVSRSSGIYHNEIVFKYNNWDDYNFLTSFDAYYYNQKGDCTSLGTIKIAVNHQETGIHTLTHLRSACGVKEDSFSFCRLPAHFYSLWQSADSYELVKKISEQTKDNIFRDLRDIAYDLKLLDKYEYDDVLNRSLFRFAPEKICRTQFHRITLGEAKLTEYHFSFRLKEYQDAGTVLDFNVYPDSCPPTNVHAIIGGNGVGKTHLIKSMIASICEEEQNNAWEMAYEGGEAEHFSNVICISFSPFDDYANIEKYEKEKDFITFIGTKKDYSANRNEDANLLRDIENQFVDSFSACCSNLTKERDLKQVFEILEADPMFNQYELKELIETEFIEDKERRKIARNSFKKMSSGHKVVLSILIRCIDKLVEKTIVFLDEPENHLHPPLLASLIRSLSTMLIKRNGVAIIATHSPIVLQEIPKSCVWLLSRAGKYIHSERPRLETFGENIGILTNDIFHYEVQHTGFHTLLENSVLKHGSYYGVLEEFNGQLGEEAKTLVRILLSQKKEKGSDD